MPNQPNHPEVPAEFHDPRELVDAATPEDQRVTLHVPGGALIAVGSPEIICARLADGLEVICSSDNGECVARIVAGVVVTYSESVLAA